jgi:hypothetical protein
LHRNPKEAVTLRFKLRCWLRPSLLIAVLAGAAPLAHSAQTIFSHNFETDPYALGWGANIPASNPWTTAASNSPTHSIQALNSLWFSPSIPVTPYEFYSVSFHSNTTGVGYFGHVEDVSALYPRTPGWNANEHVFRMDAYDNADSTRILFQQAPGGVFIDDVTVKRLTSPEAAAAIDRYTTTDLGPLLTLSQNPARHQLIPQALDKLRSGQSLKVLMLGDSIVNDTSHSYFEPLVHRMYPGAKLNVVTRFRNSTGAWFYKDHLDEYVYPYDPDLILFGGISHNNDIESVRTMVDRIKANTNAEIVLMSDLAGGANPFTNPALTQPLDPQGNEWRSRLFRLSQEEQLEFIDMTQPWAQFIQSSGRQYSDFLRDTVHMNKRGSALAGRILENFFAPLPTEWTADRNASFDDSTAWTNGAPVGVYSPATLGDSISAPRTLSLQKNVSLSRLTFDSPHAYTLAGSGQLVLDEPRFLNDEGQIRVDVLAGDHVITAPVVQNGPTQYLIGQQSSLRLGGPFRANSGVSKIGGGELRVPYVRADGGNPVYLGIVEGTLRIAPIANESSTSVVTGLSIDAIGKLDLRASALIVREGGGGADVDQLRQDLIEGRGSVGGVASGKWNGAAGITSSNAAQSFNQNNKETRAIGYAVNGAPGFRTVAQFIDQPAFPGDLLVTYTRNGDANLDGIVNNNDITLLAGFYRPGESGKHWYQADFNYDGEVNNNDITILAGLYDPNATPLFVSPGAVSGLAIVPEPGAAALLLTSSLLLRRRR